MNLQQSQIKHLRKVTEGDGSSMGGRRSDGALRFVVPCCVVQVTPPWAGTSALDGSRPLSVQADKS